MRLWQKVRVAPEAKGRNSHNRIAGRVGKVVDLHSEQPQWAYVRFNRHDGTVEFFEWVLQEDLTVVA